MDIVSLIFCILSLIGFMGLFICIIAEKIIKRKRYKKYYNEIEKKRPKSCNMA